MGIMEYVNNDKYASQSIPLTFIFSWNKGKQTVDSLTKSISNCSFMRIIM